jgi:hypothetical protein
MEKKPRSRVDYPTHQIERIIRLPQAILDQNAGKECSPKDLSNFLKVDYSGTIRSEIASAVKYGLLDRPSQGIICVSNRAKKILRPQAPEDIVDGYREIVLNTPLISEVYNHYRGENLPDDDFFTNALRDKFGIDDSLISGFKEIFLSLLNYAQLKEDKENKTRILDVKIPDSQSVAKKATDISKLEKGLKVKPDDACFVMMPFAEPIGNYYKLIYEPAIRKTGLQPLRADNEIFGTGKIIDQIWKGINGSKILIAELTNRNPNVFYELGLAHALNKPVVLVSSNQDDVPFDLQHIRVIYYDMRDPFWGEKLIEKVAENIVSALKNPEEAIFKTALSDQKN